MTLLDQCVKAEMDLIAAHVNYQKRDSAWRDMKLVEDYCEQYGIPCYVKLSHYEGKGNFQAYARDFRYAFFKELVMKYECEGVLVAHQLDDVIETYLIQKERRQIPMCYGLSYETVIDGLRIVRPLLSMSKQHAVIIVLSITYPMVMMRVISLMIIRAIASVIRLWKK